MLSVIRVSEGEGSLFPPGSLYPTHFEKIKVVYCMALLNPIARQRLSKHVPAASNTQATIELLDMMFSVLPLSYQILSMLFKESRQ
jgi:hypothetical protein